jgi:hypothetical protein
MPKYRVIMNGLGHHYLQRKESFLDPWETVDCFLEARLIALEALKKAKENFIEKKRIVKVWK